MSKRIHIKGTDIRRIVFDTIPEYRAIKDRVKCSGDKGTKECLVTVELMTGLLDSETISIFDKVGTLGITPTEHGRMNVDKIAKNLADHYGLKVSRKRRPSVGHDHRARGEIAFITLELK